MPLFGKSRKRKASESRPASSEAAFSKAPSGDQRSPPPPYEVPQLSNQHAISCPYAIQPYQVPPQLYWQANVPYRYGPYPVAASSPYLPLSPPQSPPSLQQHAALQPQRFASSTHLVPPPERYPPVQQHRFASSVNLAPPPNPGLAVQQQILASSANLALGSSCPIVSRTVDYLNRGAAVYDVIKDKFNDVINLIDDEAFSGHERDLVFNFEPNTWSHSPPPSPPQHSRDAVREERHQIAARPVASKQKRSAKHDPTLPRIAASNFFLKATMYANSYLPPELPAFRAYMPTWPLLCFAARYSRDAYEKPRGTERNSFIDADCRLGTKAMVIKSELRPDMNTIIFAIRGTGKGNFMDWAVNLHTVPTSPDGFLDDPGNLCHGGFLDVARKSVKPVAARLRQLLEQNHTRASYSLLITGHSAGGAVAALLYAHMLSETVKSELNILTGCFKRIHMVSFGAPPVSLIPLSKPPHKERLLEKSMFLSFVNEGDPVSRIERAYVASLVELYTSPAPKTVANRLLLADKAPASASASKLNLGLGLAKHEKRPKLPPRSATAPNGEIGPISHVVWKVPAATFSNAGKLVVLRVPRNGRERDVRACIATDEQMRGVVFGDVMMHMMDLYARRIKTLAEREATAGLKV